MHAVYLLRCDLFAQICMSAESVVQIRAGNKEGARILKHASEHLDDGCVRVFLEAHKRCEQEWQIEATQYWSSATQ